MVPITEVSEESPFKNESTISFRNDGSGTPKSPGANGSDRKNLELPRKSHHGRTNSQRSPAIGRTEPFRISKISCFNQSLNIPGNLRDSFLFDHRMSRDSPLSFQES